MLNINIIHLYRRLDRLELLKKELQTESISNYTIWPGIEDPTNIATGISRAHKQIVQFAMARNLPEILIAEDDLHFTSLGAFSFFLNSRPSDFDLYLGGIYFGKISDKNLVADFSGLTLYVISARFYEIFLSIDESEDLDRSLAGRGKYVVCNPFVVTQHDGYSDHTKDYQNYGSYLNGRKLFGI